MFIESSFIGPQPHALSQETKKTSAKYGEPTTGSLWIAFDRHVCEAGDVASLHAEFSRKVMADIHDGLFEFYNQKGDAHAVLLGCTLTSPLSSQKRSGRLSSLGRTN
jgi:hypothetical protein